ncbi:MAG: transporter substrate-binding domain-containing protein [Vulcanimicrobiaceae bacterium]|jgi:cyclohexadienyl dehydratase
MMIRSRFLAVLALAAVPIAAIAQTAVAPATDDLAQIRQTGVLKVGLTGDYDPFSLVDANGVYRGIDADAAAMLASAIGPNVKLQIVKTTWPTMTADLLAGKFDIAMGGVSWNEARSKVGELTAAYIQDGKVALVRASDKAKYSTNTLSNFDKPDVTVLVNPGGTNQLFVNGNIKNAKIVVVNDNLAIPNMLVAGQGDVMFTDGVEARLKASRDHRLYAVDPDHPFTHSAHVYFMQKGQTALLDFTNTWIAKMTSNGSYAKLFAKYIGS